MLNTPPLLKYRYESSERVAFAEYVPKTSREPAIVVGLSFDAEDPLGITTSCPTACTGAMQSHAASRASGATASGNTEKTPPAERLGVRTDDE
jgi:hypothetical protein